MPLSRTDDYRMKAIACEQQASDASNPTSKKDWEELAIEWHAMASLAPRALSGWSESVSTHRGFPNCCKSDSIFARLGQRFLGSNHIRQPRRVCRTMCG